MRVALVYDRVNKWGGAERVLLALHELWPEAPLYTAVYDPGRAPWARVFDVKASFLQHLPLASVHHELYPWLTPLAFETFSFDGYDAVISVTSAEAKTVITKPGTVHLCYCLTPTRYLWSGYAQYQLAPGMAGFNSLAKVALDTLAPTLRRWDLIGSSRPDYYLAISRRVAERIRQYYQRKTEAVIYPPVNTQTFKPGQKPRKNYFLVVSRLVGYKRVDLVIKAFNELDWPLLIVGDGLARSELEKKAGGKIKFITAHLTEPELVGYYQNCRALVTAASEDFGLTAVEAAACGAPVVAYHESGIAEVVSDGTTGILFGQQSTEALTSALRRFATMDFDRADIRGNAERFASKRFANEMRQIVETLVKRH